MAGTPFKNAEGLVSKSVQTYVITSGESYEKMPTGQHLVRTTETETKSIGQSRVQSVQEIDCRYCDCPTPEQHNTYSSKSERYNCLYTRMILTALLVSGEFFDEQPEGYHSVWEKTVLVENRGGNGTSFEIVDQRKWYCNCKCPVTHNKKTIVSQYYE